MKPTLALVCLSLFGAASSLSLSLPTLPSGSGIVSGISGAANTLANLPSQLGGALGSSGSDVDSAAAAATNGIPTSGSTLTDLTQTFLLASSLPSFNSSTAAAYKSMADLASQYPSAVSSVISSLNSASTLPNTDKLLNALSTFKSAVGNASTSAINETIALVQWDIKFKLGLIKSLVNLTSSNFGDASNTLNSAINNASSGLISALNSTLTSATSSLLPASTKAAMSNLMTGLENGDSQLRAGIAAAIANARGAALTSQGILGQLSSMGGQLSNGLSSAASTASSYFTSIGAGLNNLMSAGAGIGGNIGNVVLSAGR